MKNTTDDVKHEPVEIEVPSKPVRWRFILVPPNSILGDADVFAVNTPRNDFARNPTPDDFAKAGYMRIQENYAVNQAIEQYRLTDTTETPKDTVHRLAGDLHVCRGEIFKLQNTNDILRSEYNKTIDSCKKLERKLASAEAELYNTQVLAEKYKAESELFLEDRTFVETQRDQLKEKLKNITNNITDITNNITDEELRKVYSDAYNKAMSVPISDSSQWQIAGVRAVAECFRKK